MCAKCLPRYWLDGFLCEPCGSYYAWLGPLLTALALALLALFVRSRLARHERFVVQEAANSPAKGPSRAAFLWDEPSAVGRTDALSSSPSGGSGSGAIRFAPLSEEERAQPISILVWFLQVGATLTLSTQFNSASSGEVQDNGSTATGLTWIDQITSFRPWAPECAVDSWDYQTSTTVLLFLPWLVASVATAVALAARRAPHLQRRCLTCCVLLLDLCVRARASGVPAVLTRALRAGSSCPCRSAPSSGSTAQPSATW
jgi:hypothetical protein